MMTDPKDIPKMYAEACARYEAMLLEADAVFWLRCGFEFDELAMYVWHGPNGIVTKICPRILVEGW